MNIRFYQIKSFPVNILGKTDFFFNVSSNNNVRNECFIIHMYNRNLNISGVVPNKNM